MTVAINKGSFSFVSGVFFTILLLLGFYLGFDSRGALSDRTYIIGEPVPEGIIAVHDFSVFYNTSELEENANEIESSIPIYLISDEQIALNSSEEIEHLIFQATGNSDLARYFGQRVEVLYGTGIIDIQALRDVYHGTHAITNNEFSENISELFTLDEARDGIRLDMERRGVLQEKIPVILELMIPNLVIDNVSRDSVVQEAIDDLPQIKKEFSTGELILPPGGLFTHEMSRYWDAMIMSPLGTSGVVEHNIAKTGLAAILLSLAFVFLYKEQRVSTLSYSDLLLLFTIWGLALGLTILLFRSGVRELVIFSFTMLGAGLTSVFFDSRTRDQTISYAWFLSAIFAAIFALVSPHPMATFLMGFIPSCFVSILIRDLTDKGTSNALMAGIFSSILVYWLLATAGNSGTMLFDSLGWTTLIGFPILIIGTIMILRHPLELLFRVATARTYEKLSNENHPLRVLLKKEALGTYNHSVIVSDLAASAADELGLDVRLAKLGGIFHDVGKIKNPGLFIENIISPEKNNPHNNMLPERSVEIIINHVSDGVKLAKEYHLPADIRGIIQQHHGDTSVRFFLEKARKANTTGQELDESVFYYNQPKPQSVEAALVMLADSVSSAVKGLDKTNSTESKENIVFRIVREKAEEGQFDQCKLTGAMRTRAAQGFVKYLTRDSGGRVKNFPHGS